MEAVTPTGMASLLVTSLQDAYFFVGTEAGGLIIWGVVARGLLAIAALSLVSLAWQARGLAGSQGQTPAAMQLTAFFRDFGPRAFAFWPTLLWPAAVLPPVWGDAMLVFLPAAAASVAVVGALVGGLAARLGATAALATLLSVDTIHALVYPWDSLLIEALWL